MVIADVSEGLDHSVKVPIPRAFCNGDYSCSFDTTL